ncbi:ADP-ribosylation factor-binding protein GGA1 [Notothenia coriiceps]|uniref:ADP-ribosylation factor-binding protein GGA1 n=1 Tax=Notothenia coriiceps TaxID=8208 RepID=A0A6I9MMZ1_9TELE|nr:PREDICTED: ADP-ribosylation factor-binding protein GGA1 [Notothenia coriiceps]
MAAAPPDEATLQSRINKATNPLNKDTDWDIIKGFCDQLNNDPEGPQVATRLLAHKVQSPQEWEAMQALLVLETCMKSCGKRFHIEVGKFRFLNELIKVVSPKYLGTRAPEPVKNKVIEIMFSWTVKMPHETKIADAYQMLKKQGIVKVDPALPEDKPLPPPAPRAKNIIFEDEEKSKVADPCGSSSALVDLMGLNASSNTAPSDPEPLSLQTLIQNMGISLLDDELMSLGLNLTENFDSQNTFQSSDGTESSAALGPAVLQPAVVQTAAPPAGGPAAPPKPIEGLDLLGKTLLQQSLPPESQQVKWDKLQPQSRVTLRDMQTKSNANPKATSISSNPAPAPVPTFSMAVQSEPPDSLLLPNLSLAVSADPYDNISLADVTVPLEAIKPSSLLPVTVFDKHSLRVLFTFAHDCPPSRPEVLVVIISMLSSAPIPVTNIRFQAAVPKVMKVKLQPPSSTELPAYNPILPPAVITQILLLANPHKEKVRLRYKLTFNLGYTSHDESGDVDQFPPPHTWGSL